MCPSVLIVGPENINGIGLRALLKQMDVKIVGDVIDLQRASSRAAALHPDVIVIDALFDGALLVSLYLQLRECSLSSKILLLGDEGQPEMTSVQIRPDGYLLWSDLNAAVLRDGLAAMGSGLWIRSPTVVEQIPDTHGRGYRFHKNEISLTPLERAILQGLASGLKQREIADEEHVSEPTMWRATAALCAKFGVPTTNALRAKAALIGLIA